MKGWKNFERDVAKALGDWWGFTFRRTPSSGAWGKQGASRTAEKAKDAAGNFHGDIVAGIEAEFPFSVECKAHKAVELYKALYGKSNIFEWWKQCKDDTPKGMWPMLIMKENMKKPLVGISVKCLKKLSAHGVRLGKPHYVLMGAQLVIFELSKLIVLDVAQVKEALRGNQ